MSEPSLKLPRGADELLRDFPMTEPDFEAQAKAIEAKLSSKPVEGALSDDELFRAPALAAEKGEPSLPVPPSTVRAAPKSNFAEMARKSLQKTDDDATALAKELLVATAQNRRPNAELVERVKAAGRASATASPLPTGERERERTSGVVTRVETAAAVAPPAAAKPASTTQAAPAGVHRGTVIGIFGTVVAIAACIALYVKSSAPEASPTSLALQAEKAADAPGVASPKPASAAAPPLKPSEGVVSLEALAPAREPPTAAPEKAAAKAGAVAMAAPAAAPGASSRAAPAGSAAKQEAVVLEEDPAPAQAPVAEKKAEPAPEPALKPAEGSSGSVPLNPSAGAVSTALGPVRSSAQACLAGQTESVSASITFASDGHVLAVRAGGPSGACIQAALSKAHIAPFAKESFTASTTVRPP